MTYLILLLSLTALIAGADLLVRGAVNLAAALGVPTLIIGLTVVAWGTSAPELVVSITAGLQGEYGIAIGNIVGSNIANILLIGGFAAVLMPLMTNSEGLRSNVLILLAVSALLAAFILTGRLSFWAGVLFLAIQGGLLYMAFRARDIPEEAEAEGLSLPYSSLLTLGGMILVGGGGYFLVESAQDLAELWHVPPAIIGLSVVAIGTSLPELAATIAAVRQRQGDLILGNILGSNLANILVVFGTTALLVPGKINRAEDYEPEPVLGVMLIATLVLVGFILAKRPVGRLVGGILLAVYTLFIIGSFFLDGPKP